MLALGYGTLQIREETLASEIKENQDLMSEILETIFCYDETDCAAYFTVRLRPLSLAMYKAWSASRRS